MQLLQQAGSAVPSVLTPPTDTKMLVHKTKQDTDADGLPLSQVYRSSSSTAYLAWVGCVTAALIIMFAEPTAATSNVKGHQYTLSSAGQGIP